MEKRKRIIIIAIIALGVIVAAVGVLCFLNKYKWFSKEKPVTDIVENGDLVEFTVVADGFLYNMVRIMIGTLLWIDSGKLKPQDIPSIIESQKRENAGFTAPSEGLYLKKIYY